MLDLLAVVIEACLIKHIKGEFVSVLLRNNGERALVDMESPIWLV